MKAPIIILHGDQDDIIPFQHGEKLATIPEHSTFIRIPEGRHNNLATFELYWNSIEQFLGQISR
ncbi:hypothetical protein D3C72_2337150 [compost metagenome]